MAPNDSTTPGSGPDPARCFGSVVDAYERGRPGYPVEAARWLTGDEPLSVLELGSGTGKLTRELVALGHDVHATDPDAAMLDILARNYVVTRISQTTAEEIPVPDSTFDIVIAAQAYHWFDHDEALPEIARVLKRGGSLSLVWNTRDERIPWVKRLGRVIGSQEQGAGPGDELESSPYFGPVEHESLQALADHRPLLDPGPRPVTLQHRHPVRGGAGGQAARGARLLRRLRPRHGRHAAALRHRVLPRGRRHQAAVCSQDADRRREQRAESTGYVGEDTQPVALSDAAEISDVIDPPTDDDSGMLLIDFR